MSHLNPQQALQLVRKLATDSDFHTRFQQSPAAALQELGLPSQFSECCTGIKLPTQAVLQQSEAALVTTLTSHTAQTVIGLNAN